MSTAPVTQSYGPCPCGCSVTGTKLTVHGHLRGCECRSCLGRRNRRKGKAANRTAHRRLAPELERTVDDDIFHAYAVSVSVEIKTGAQIPAKLLTGLRSEWARHAWRQASKKVPAGVQAFPAIVCEVTPSESYLCVRLGEG